MKCEHALQNLKMNTNWAKFLPSFILVRLDGRQNLQKALTNVGWLFGDRILRMGVGLFVGVWVARYLGPEQFGLLNYASAFVALFGTFSTLGLDSIIVRDLIQNPSEKDETLGTAFTLKLIGGIVILLSTLTIISLIRSDSITHWLVGIIAAGTIFQAFDTIDFWFQSQVQSKYVVYAKNSAFILITIIKIVLLYMKAPLIAFAWTGLAEVILASLGLIFAYGFNNLYIQTWRVSIKRAKSLLKNSWLLVLSGLAIMVYMRIDQIMLGQMVGDKAVGIYSAAVKLSEIWYFIPIAITSSVFPSLVEAKKTSEILHQQRIQKLFYIMVLISYVIAVPVTFLSSWLIVLVFGEQFVDASVSLIALTWAGVFVCLGLAKESWMITEGLMKLTFFATAVGAVTNVLINLLLIPSYGASGASIATLISYFIAVVLSTLIFPETRKVFKMQINSLFLYGIAKK